MTIDTQNLLNSILASLERIEYIHPDDIPSIDLYMDQVTTLMDHRLKNTARYPEQDKVLTKTMINNYAKNDLLPPPVKKKYSKEHILLLVFIYYMKNILSIGDIQTLLNPITDKFFQDNKDISLEDIYSEVFGMQADQVEALKEDVIRKFHRAEETFSDAPKEDKEFLQHFSFICLLAFDVYVKKLMLEKLIDGLSVPPAKEEKKAKKNQTKSEE